MNATTWEYTSQEEYCLSRHPIAGTSCNDTALHITITAHLRTGTERGAQIVVVNNDKVAKIYDPLYCRWTSEWGYNGQKEDVVRAADQDYYREAVAYEELRGTDAEGNVTASYFGSWTMEVDGEHGQRRVALILIEYIQGRCMLDMDPTLLSEKQRKDAIARVLEADALLHYHGVDQADLHLRNILFAFQDPKILLAEVEFSLEKVRVVIIDFNVSEVYRLEGRKHAKLQGLKPLNPACLHCGLMGRYANAGWLSTEEARNGDWLWRRYKGDARYRDIKRAARARDTICSVDVPDAPLT
jgi:serine/threonine protein kinase